MILLDASVWSIYLRRKQQSLNSAELTIWREVDRLILERQVAIIGTIRQEILSGLRHADQYEVLRTRLRAFPDEPLRMEDYEFAAQCDRECLSIGVTGSVVDLLIAAVAIERVWP